MLKPSKLHFARFEFKYLLPLALRNEIESELGYFVDPDPFVTAMPDLKYWVRSLYFDDPFFSSFFDKIDGIHTRYKFRIRTYTNDPAGKVPVFLEKKGRYNNLVFKHRTVLDTNNTGNRNRQNDMVKIILDKALLENDKVCGEFAYEYYRKNLKPVALIDYFRRPYISKYDPEFRLTFDDHLKGYETHALHPARTDRSRMILRGYTVLEVKFRYHIPSWFHRIIQSYELKRVSISKICHGIETLELANGFME